MSLLPRVHGFIEHSGKRWYRMGTGRLYGFAIWSIDEYFARVKHTKAVVDRIRRLNPVGKEEGVGPRGYHPSYYFKHEGRRKKQRCDEPSRGKICCR